MELWWITLVSFSIFFFLKALQDYFVPSSRLTLPPGPFSLPFIGNTVLLRTSIYDLEALVWSLHSKLGPLVTLTLGSRKYISIGDSTLAHQTLIHNGATFADRPPPTTTERIISYNKHNISSCGYGPNWRLLRKNLTSGTLQHFRQISESSVHNKVLHVLVEKISESAGPVHFVQLFSRALVFAQTPLCFGVEVDYDQAVEIQRKSHKLTANMYSFPLIDMFPRLSKILLKGQWKEFQKLVTDNEEVMLPLILARKKAVQENPMSKKGELIYLDTLLDMELPEEKRKLTDGELVSLCFEFLVALVDTTTTVLQWMFANLVKYQHIQEKLHADVEKIMGKNVKEKVISQERLGKMRYVKAVVMETLRRHPPGHFLLPHAISEDVMVGDRLLPKNGSVNFMVAEIAKDPKIWEDPMEFKPERFMDEEVEVDITGTKEIKMLPFGAGRRICPGYIFAMQQLSYIVANLVWRFHWKPVEGVGVDLTEGRDFTIRLMHPLQVNCIPRKN